MSLAEKMKALGLIRPKGVLSGAWRALACREFLLRKKVPARVVRRRREAGRVSEPAVPWLWVTSWRPRGAAGVGLCCSALGP